MPSYRVSLEIGVVRPGVRADAVLPAAAAATARLATVEATDIRVDGRVPRIVVRFTGDDADAAARIGRRVAAATARHAEVRDWRLTVREGGRWEPVVSTFCGDDAATL